MKEVKHPYHALGRRLTFYLILSFLLHAPFVQAQDEPEYEEISVFLMVQRVGGIEIPAVYYNQSIYLPVQDVFDFLNIKNIPSPQYDSVSGFFIHPEASYLIDWNRNRILYGGKIFDLKPGDLVRTETNLYLKSNYFGELFGLDCTFNFRSLSVTLNTKIELPVIRDMRLELMRGNISRMKGEVVADTVIPRSNPLFKFGMADWSILSNQEINGESQTRLDLGLGSMVAGGELNVNLQHHVNQPITEKQQYYLWRYVNNDRKAVRQVLAGKIASQAISSIYNPVIGMQITNAPTTYRRSFGKYTLTDYTEPDWSVELYVNNVLVDFVKADANGFFTFEVPLMYGSTSVLLRFYGPFGEERSKQQSISVPYNFLPSKELQYTLSAGMVEDSLHSLFSRANANYGLGKYVTIGGGMEYLSSVSAGSIMPFVNTSMRLGSNLLLSGEYTYGVRGKGILNYRTARNLQVELNYSRYDPNQTAIGFNYLEERRAMVSFPIRTRRLSAYSRFSLSQNILPSTKYSTAEWLLSGVVMGVSANLTTYAMFPNLANPYVYSNLSLGFRLPGKIIFRPQAQFEYVGQQLMLVKGEMEKQFLKHGFLNVSYEYNFKASLQNIQVGFRYDFSIAQTGFSYRNSNNINTLYESARGSLLFDRKTKYAGATNRSSIGRGGIVILTYLDMNANGKFDQGESKVTGLRININGGRVEQSKRDSVTRVFDLEPYVSYFIELDRFSFDNIAWQMAMKNMSVVVDPNIFKLVEIPISVMGEASGMVTFTGSGGEKGLARVIIDFYKSDGTFFAKTLTESDGYFSFLGLPAGSYIARVDTAQLRKLNMSATPAEYEFDLELSTDGDVRDGLDFLIRSYKVEPPVIQAAEKKQLPEELKKAEEKPQPGDRKKTEDQIEAEPVKEEPVVDKAKNAAVIMAGKATSPAVPKVNDTVFSIQLAASRTYADPLEFKKKFNLTDEVLYFEKDGWFKYVTGQFPTSKEAAAKMALLGVNGFITKVDQSALKGN